MAKKAKEVSKEATPAVAGLKLAVAVDTSPRHGGPYITKLEAAVPVPLHAVHVVVVLNTDAGEIAEAFAAIKPHPLMNDVVVYDIAKSHSSGVAAMESIGGTPVQVELHSDYAGFLSYCQRDFTSQFNELADRIDAAFMAYASNDDGEYEAEDGPLLAEDVEVEADAADALYDEGEVEETQASDLPAGAVDDQDEYELPFDVPEEQEGLEYEEEVDEYQDESEDDDGVYSEESDASEYDDGYFASDDDDESSDAEDQEFDHVEYDEEEEPYVDGTDDYEPEPEPEPAPQPKPSRPRAAASKPAARSESIPTSKPKATSKEDKTIEERMKGLDKAGLIELAGHLGVSRAKIASAAKRPGTDALRIIIMQAVKDE